jgi:hypothetical protein
LSQLDGGVNANYFDDAFIGHARSNAIGHDGSGGYYLTGDKNKLHLTMKFAFKILVGYLIFLLCCNREERYK